MIRTQSAAVLALVLLLCQSMSLFAAPPPRTDVYGDPLPDGVRVRMGTIQLRHAKAHVTFSADGRQLLSCGQDGLVRHWSLASGRLVRESQLCKTQQEKKQLVSVTLGGGCAALIMSDGVILRDVESGEERGRLPLKVEQGNQTTPSTDGKFFLVQRNAGPDHTIVDLWEVRRGKKIRSGKYPFGVWKALFARDGKQVALRTGHQDLRLWDIATGKEVQTNGTTGWGISFAPDGKTLAVKGLGGPVKLLDTKTLKVQARLQHPQGADPQPFIQLDFSADGRLLAEISPDGLFVWDVAARKIKHRLPEFQADALAFAPDGKTLACWSGVVSSEIRLWDVATGKQLHSRPGHPQRVDVLAVSPDGKIVASGALHDPYLHLWDAATGRLLHRLKGRDNWMTACVFSADGKKIVSAGSQGSLQMWNVSLAKEVHHLTVVGRPSGNLSDSPTETFLRMSADGERLSTIVIDDKGLAAVWDLSTGKLLSQRSYKVDVHRRDQPDGGYGMWIETHVALAPDGQSVTARKDRRLTIEDVRNGRVLALLPEKAGRPVAFSPDGWLVAAAVLKSKADPFESPTMEGLRLIESATGQEVVRIETGQGYLIAFSSDGRLLASIDKAAIHIWDVATGKEFFRRPWPAHVAANPDWSPATALAFLPSGRGVVTGMDEGTLLVWDVPARPKTGPATQESETWEGSWSALAGDARKAHKAVYTLAATPAATVSFLADRLKPAAEVNGKHVTKLLADLDNGRFEVRESATRELTRLRDDIEPALRRFLENKPSLEVRRRIEAILLSPQPVPDAATLRTLRALRVLEMIGTPEARQLLHKLAGGAPGARQTREATAALQRLEFRPSPSR